MNKTFSLLCGRDSLINERFIMPIHDVRMRALNEDFHTAVYQQLYNS